MMIKKMAAPDQTTMYSVMIGEFVLMPSLSIGFECLWMCHAEMNTIIAIVAT